MAYDTRLLARARDVLEARRRENRREQDRRRALAAEKAPEALELERELTGLMAQVVGAALRKGDDPERAVAEIQQRSARLQERQRLCLERAGLPGDSLDDIYSCPKCRDTGYVLGQACSCLMEEYQKQREAELSRMLRGQSGDFADFRLDIYDEATRPFMAGVLELAKKYAASFTPESQNLLLRGGPGLGKSALCACIAQAVFEAGHTVILDTVAGALGQYEAAKFSREHGEAAAREVRRLEESELLLLDDLGTEMLTSFSQSALYGLLDARLTARRPTVLVTGLTPEALAERYNPQLTSRLEGEFTSVQFYGRDQRRKKED